jgi:hypothetical protein
VSKNVSSISPEEAYYLYKRIAINPMFEEYRSNIEEKAKSLLSSSPAPTIISLDALLKNLDTTIGKEQKKLCDKYSNVEPGPYVPPPPDYDMNIAPINFREPSKSIDLFSGQIRGQVQDSPRIKREPLTASGQRRSVAN